MIFIIILMNIKNVKQFLSSEKHVQECKFIDKVFIKTAAVNERIMIKNENIKNK